MRKALAAILVAVGMLAATQVFYMGVEQALDFTEAVILARVETIVHFPGDYTDRVEYFFKVIDVISGPDSLEGGIVASYSMLYPRPFYDDEGNEIWESPINSGSGYEQLTGEGDTVIVFLDRLPEGQFPTVGVVRVDPADSLESILLLLNPED